MHIRPNQPDPNIQLDALHSAQKAAAKARSQGTRRKLSEFASQLAGEAGEAYVVEVEAKGDSRERHPRNLQNEWNGKQRGRPTDSSGSGEHSVSDWA